MFISEEDFQTYVTYAIARAKHYVDENLPKGGLDEKDDKNLTASIHAYLKTDPHPYDSESIRQAIEHILRKNIENAEPATPRAMVYLAGSIASPNLLMEAVRNPDVTADAIRELRGVLDGKIRSDFADHKATFTQVTGIPTVPYGKVRGIMSGVDQALVKIANENDFGMIKADSLGPLDEQQKSNVLRQLEEVAQTGVITVYAMMLTKREAMEAAANLGMPEDEAARSAQAFRDFFPVLRGLAPNITVLDRNFQTIYQQHNGKAFHMIPKHQSWLLADAPAPASGQGPAVT